MTQSVTIKGISIQINNNGLNTNSIILKEVRDFLNSIEDTLNRISEEDGEEFSNNIFELLCSEDLSMVRMGITSTGYKWTSRFNQIIQDTRHRGKFYEQLFVEMIQESFVKVDMGLRKKSIRTEISLRYPFIDQFQFYEFDKHKYALRFYFKDPPKVLHKDSILQHDSQDKLLLKKSEAFYTIEVLRGCLYWADDDLRREYYIDRVKEYFGWYSLIPNGVLRISFPISEESSYHIGPILNGIETFLQTLEEYGLKFQPTYRSIL